MTKHQTNPSPLPVPARQRNIHVANAAIALERGSSRRADLSPCYTDKYKRELRDLLESVTHYLYCEPSGLENLG